MSIESLFNSTFLIYKPSYTLENIGSTTISYAVSSEVLDCYITYLEGREVKFSGKQNVVASHRLFCLPTPVELSTADRVYVIETNQWFNVLYIDNSDRMGHHFELLLENIEGPQTVAANGDPVPFPTVLEIAKWNSTYTTVNDLSSDWVNSFTTVSSFSAYWNNAYTNLVSNSAAYLSAEDLTPYAKLDGSNQPFTGFVKAPNLSSVTLYTDQVVTPSILGDTVIPLGITYQDSLTLTSPTTAFGHRFLTSTASNQITAMVIYKSGHVGFGGTVSAANLYDRTTKLDSANWSSAYTNLVSNSAAYLSAVDLSLIASTSGSWNSAYTTTNSNSANWQTAYTGASSYAKLDTSNQPFVGVVSISGDPNFAYRSVLDITGGINQNGIDGSSVGIPTAGSNTSFDTGEGGSGATGAAAGSFTFNIGSNGASLSGSAAATVNTFSINQNSGAAVTNQAGNATGGAIAQINIGRASGNIAGGAAIASGNAVGGTGPFINIFTGTNTGGGGTAQSTNNGNATGGQGGRFSVMSVGGIGIGGTASGTTSGINTGGQGFTIILNTANGGAASGSTVSNVGGAGGSWTATARAGGVANSLTASQTASATSGKGGDIFLGQAGAAGSTSPAAMGSATAGLSGVAIGGAGGVVSIWSQTGGGATVGPAGRSVGGNGGNINLITGLGGTASGGLSANGDNGDVVFYSGTNEVMRLDNTAPTIGRLGIGVTAPTSILHLKAGTATAGTAPLKINSGTLMTNPEAGAVEFLTDDIYLTSTTGTTRRKIGGASMQTPKWYPTSDTTTALQINKADNTTNIVTFNTLSGMVGIGSTTPNYKLHISSTQGASAETCLALQSVVAGNATAFIRFFGTTNSDISNLAYSSFIGGERNATPAGHSLVFGTANGVGAIPVERMRIDPTGNVGIGTVTPSTTLDVSGSATIRGALSAQQAMLGQTVNTTSFSTSGIQLMAGAARVWKDHLGDAVALRQSGTGVGYNTTEGTVEFITTANLGDYIYTNIQLNHDRDETSVISPHIHWLQKENKTPNWLLQYRWNTLGQTITAGWTNLKCNTNVFSYVSGTLHQISESSDITPPANSTLSDIVQFRILRDNANTSTVFVSADPSSITVGVLAFDVHYQLNTLGSKTEWIK